MPRSRAVVMRARFIDAISLGIAREQHRLGSEAPLVLEAISASVLVLDDLGQEAPRHAEVIRHVVRMRSDAMRSTWVTTWLTREELAERYADAGFAARIYESKRIQFEAGTP